MKSLSLFSLIFFLLNPGARSMNLLDPRTEETKEENRPPIYTFFQVKLRRDGKYDFDGHHEEILEAWSKAWYEAGWEPIILNLDDAKQHPDFEHYSSRFENLTHEEAFIFGESYNYMCLMRWLAMAAQRVDGWMSDYDTYPLHISPADGQHLPNEGRFTVYENMVPSLLSGSASEWDRIAKQLFENVYERFNAEGTQEIYSDMYALENMFNTAPNHAKPFISERRVDTYPYIAMHELDCERTTGVLALHLSHRSTWEARDKGLIPSNIGDGDRYICSQMIKEDFEKQCVQQQEGATHLRG